MMILMLIRWVMNSCWNWGKKLGKYQKDFLKHNSRNWKELSVHKLINAWFVKIVLLLGHNVFDLNVGMCMIRIVWKDGSRWRKFVLYVNRNLFDFYHFISNYSYIIIHNIGIDIGKYIIKHLVIQLLDNIL